MKTLALALCCTPLLALAATAQTTIVDPPEFKNREGYSGYRYTGGNRHVTPNMRVWQFQQIHDNLATKGPVTIKGMAFRRDGGASFHWNAWKIDMEMRLATCPVSSQNFSNVFASNMGNDIKTVIARKWVNLPPMPRTLAMPEPFHFKLLFDPGKTFTLAKGKSLAWHWVGYDNDLYTAEANHHYLDLEYHSDYSPTKALPGGCFAMGWSYFRPQYCTTSAWHDVTNNRIAIYGYTDHGPFLGVGVHAIGLPLPVAGTSIPVGGPDHFNMPCRLFLNPSTLRVSTPYKLDTKGYYSTPKEQPFWILPADPAFYGLTLWSQSFTIGSSNVLYTSNVDMVQIHYRYPTNRWMGVSYLEIAEKGRHLDPSSPYFRKNACLVTQFTL